MTNVFAWRRLFQVVSPVLMEHRIDVLISVLVMAGITFLSATFGFITASKIALAVDAQIAGLDDLYMFLCLRATVTLVLWAGTILLGIFLSFPLARMVESWISNRCATAHRKNKTWMSLLADLDWLRRKFIDLIIWSMYFVMSLLMLILTVDSVVSAGWTRGSAVSLGLTVLVLCQSLSFLVSSLRGSASELSKKAENLADWLN